MRIPRGMSAVLATASLVLLLARCTGIETTNGVTVVASSSSISGNTPPLAIVSVFDTAYIPYIRIGTTRTVTADEAGNFAIDGLLPGMYNVIVTASDSHEAVFFPEVEIKPGAGDSQLRAILEPVGSVTGMVADVPDTIPNILIYIPGTGYYARLPEAGAFAISTIPVGVYDLQMAGFSMIDSLIDKMGNISRNERVAVTVNPESATNVGTLKF
jgi:hypothetical protein